MLCSVCSASRLVGPYGGPVVAAAQGELVMGPGVGEQYVQALDRGPVSRRRAPGRRVGVADPVQLGSTSTNRVLSTGQGTVTRGVVQGIYLFRAVS